MGWTLIQMNEIFDIFALKLNTKSGVVIHHSTSVFVVAFWSALTLGSLYSCIREIQREAKKINKTFSWMTVMVYLKLSGKENRNLACRFFGKWRDSRTKFSESFTESGKHISRFTFHVSEYILFSIFYIFIVKILYNCDAKTTIFLKRFRNSWNLVGFSLRLQGSGLTSFILYIVVCWF